MFAVALVLTFLTKGIDAVNLSPMYNPEYQGSYIYLKNISEAEKEAIEHKNMLLMKAIEYDYYHSGDKYGSAFRNYHY